MNRLCLLTLVVVLLGGVAAAQTVSVDFMPAMFVQDYGMGISHEVNNYTISSDQDVTHGTWVILGTDDEELFDLLDTRLFVDFSAGIQQQFNFTNTVSYRCYYLYLTGGFPVGANLEIHFNYSTLQTPAEQFTSPFNFTVKRGARMVHIFDFSKNPPSGGVNSYSIASSETLANSQTWYMYGSNSITLGDSSATPMLIDTQTSIGFTANVPKFFDISLAPNYNYYILYIKNGFYVNDMTIEVAFNSSSAPEQEENITCASPAPEAGFLPVEIIYVLAPLATFLSIFAVGSLRNRVYANIVIGGFTSSGLWLFLAANIITGNIFYTSSSKACIVSDIPLFWIFILFGVVMIIYTLVLAMEAITERKVIV